MNKKVSKEDLIAAYQKFENNYDLVWTYYQKEHTTDRIVLESKENKKCRFCGAQTPDVSFKKEAHALSRLIGNNHLFSNYECDTCNEHIFSVMESNFAEYMKIYHCLLGVKGRKKIPSYKQEDGRIDNVNRQIEVEVIDGNIKPMVKINQENNTIIFQGKRTYIPQLVYKALLKMALTVMPDTEMTNLTCALDFLMHNKESVSPLYAVFQMYMGGYNVFKDVAAIICKRKSDCVNMVPEYIFILAYNNFCFQIPVLSDANVKSNPQLFTLPILPTPPLLLGYPMRQTICNFGSMQQVSEEPVYCSMSFEDMIEKEINN